MRRACALLTWGCNSAHPGPGRDTTADTKWPPFRPCQILILHSFSLYVVNKHSSLIVSVRLTDPVNTVTTSQESLRNLLEKHFKITAKIFFPVLKNLICLMLIYNSYFLCYKCCDPLLDFFFLEKYTKRQERFCYFLMKTILTLKYPVFIRVTKSNSKVHPFIDRM